MRRRFATAVALLLCVTAAHGQELSLNDFLEVVGHVRAPASIPIEDALVIAFSLSETLNLRTNSGKQGQFELPPLPVGVYRVVAVKKGFLPAAATVTPSRRDHRVVLELERQGTASEEKKADAWTLRLSLPKDVLRQVEVALGSPAMEIETAERTARFAGSMESLAGYSGMSAERELERTSVAFHSDLGQWGLEFHGSRQLIGQPEGPDDSIDQAEAADVALEVRSSMANAYRVTSTRASWRQWPTSGADAGVESHSIAWQGRVSSVQVRYLSHENLFPSPGIEDTLEVAGNALIYKGSRSDLDVSLRLTQDDVAGDGYIDGMQERYADLATTGRYVVTDGLGLEYGVVTRLGEETLQIMPQSAVELRLGASTRIQFAGAYKFDTTPESLRKSAGIAYLGQFPTIDTQYKYSVTLSRDLGEKVGFSMRARRSAADALTFLLFDDRFDEFWDGLYMHKGEVLSDGTLSIRADMGSSLQIAVITSAGRVDGRETAVVDKGYVSGEIRTHYEPSGTSLDVSYRFLEQPDLVDDSLIREIERLSVVLGQSLHLPVDLRLLFGFSVAYEGTTIAELSESARSQKRLVGGVSFSF